MIIPRILLALIPLAVTLAPSATASPIIWTLHNVTFNDGGALQGSFSFDSSNSSVSNINVITTAGTAFGGAVYTVDSNSSAGGLNFFTTLTGNLTGAHELGANFGSLLTAGTSANITFLAEDVCQSSNCASASVLRTATPGGFVSADGVAAPEPGFGLLLLPLAALAFRVKQARA